ncbi:hypothetical protein BDQ17DRAFT_1377653 [Cyathus striatus]|nr:hypothetical protein BDQ17DRAFT_1377653 [Cyathus striatus]
MASILFPTPRTPFEVSISPASSTSTLVASEEDFPYSRHSRKISDITTPKHAFDSTVLPSSQLTPTGSHFPLTTHAASKPTGPVTAATLLSALMTSVASVPPSNFVDSRREQQLAYTPSNPVNLVPQQPPSPQTPRADYTRSRWLPRFLAGIEPAIPVDALKLHAHSLISCCPVSVWTPSEIASLAAAFAECALEYGAVESAKDGSWWDSAAPFALQLFLVLRQKVGEDAAALFTRELVERTVGVWFGTWNPNYPGCILFRKKAPSMTELKQHMNLSRFIGEMFKAKFISRAQFAECLWTLMQDLVFVEQIVALRNLIKHAGKAYWFEERLVSLGLVPAYPEESMYPIPKEEQVVVDVDGFLKELAVKVDAMEEMVSLAGVRSRSESVLNAVNEIIREVWRWKDEIERDMKSA